MKRLSAVLLFIAVLACTAAAQRRIKPVETPATVTQSINETAADTSRINARRRAQSISYIDDRGLTIYVDTVTNIEWTDSTLIGRVPKMIYPLLHSASIGVNIWDPVMRIFGQEHGLADIWAEVDFHNRYKPTVEIGLGTASHPAPDGRYMYHSPLSVFFRIGANYNFLFNSNPDYQFMAGVRYGFSPFSFHVDNVKIPGGYWGEPGTFDIPSQHVTAGWLEFSLSLRVKLWGPVSAGWSFKFHSLLHESACTYGKPWYIPGYGTRNGSVTGSFSIVYTIPLRHLNKPDPDAVIEGENLPEPPPPPQDTIAAPLPEPPAPTPLQQ